MKISRLYIKYFITVMAIIIAAQICIAGLFRIVGAAAGKKYIQPELSCIAFLLRDYINSESGNPENKDLPFFIADLSRAWSSDIWLEDRNGKLIASSTQSSRPAFPEQMKEFTEYGLSREPGGPPPNYMIIKSIDAGKILYIKKKERRVFFEEFYFIAGLGIITLIVALILFPISKNITVPLKKLTESADAISRGEFDTRVEETSHDEVGELAKAFNIMSGRVLQMINGTKELTANISHHIRSPLTRISVSVELMRDKIVSGKMKDAESMLSSIEQEIEEIVRLTENIIELIRVEVAHKSDEYSKMSLTDIASETFSKYKDLMQLKSIYHSIDYSKIPVNIYGVYRDICELFDILYDNAVRYTYEKGSISFSIYQDDGEVTITLANNSLPLTEDMLNSIFEPFKRFAPEKISGNGLGLAIAKRIVENHEGSIQAESKGDFFSLKIVFRQKRLIS